MLEISLLAIPDGWQEEYIFHRFDEGCTILKTGILHRHCAATLEEGTIWAYEEETDFDELRLLPKDFPVLRAMEMDDYGSEFCALVRLAPLLERVTKKAMTSPTPLPHVRHLVELLSRTTCANLTSLTLVSIQAPLTDAIDCLKAAQTLAKLYHGLGLSELLQLRPLRDGHQHEAIRHGGLPLRLQWILAPIPQHGTRSR
ncbi:hypothetical protein GGF50DRAFT_118669 [Schizophyllum commune]